MKKILMMLLLCCCLPVHLQAEHQHENETEIISASKDNSTLSVFDFSEYSDLSTKLDQFTPEEKALFFENMTFEERIYYYDLRSFACLQQKQTQDIFSVCTSSQGVDRSANAKIIRSLDGFQSGAFYEGKGVDFDKEMKYLYEGDTMRWSGTMNQRSDRIEFTSNQATLWIPHWGEYLGEAIGASVNVERLHSENGLNFLFASMDGAFKLYTENAKQSKITVRFYRHVDMKKPNINGEQISWKTKFEYLLFGAMGLTNETEHTDSIEYTAAVDDSLPVYSSLRSEDIGQSEEYGKTVYYNTHQNHNSDFFYNVKDLKEMALLVGIKGNDNYKTGGDSSMYFCIGFNAHGLIPNAYILHINPDGGQYQGPLNVEGHAGEKVEIAIPEKPGYLFKGWEVEGGQLNQNTYTFAEEDGNLKARWEEEKFPIYYDLAGGTNHPENPVFYTRQDEIHLRDPQRNGYRFVYWHPGSVIAKGSSGEKKFIANWELEHYAIHYFLVGGRNHPKNPSSYTITEEITLLDPEKKGYIFVGWKEGNKIYKGSSGEKEFHAQWQAERYPIEYILQGGQNDLRNPTTYTVEDEITLLEAKRTGYIFKGWKEGKVIPLGSSGKKQFTAIWEKEHYPITYDLMDSPELPASNNENPSQYYFGDHIILKNPQRPGYRFLAWQEGNEILPGSQGKKHFTAKWEKEIYHIYYELDGGINSEKNATHFTVEDEILFYNPTRKFFNFLAWKQKGKQIEKILPFSTFEDVHVKAEWQSTCSPGDKNCDGVIDCEESYGPGYRWNNYQKACLYGPYTVVDTSYQS